MADTKEGEEKVIEEKMGDKKIVDEKKKSPSESSSKSSRSAFKTDDYTSSEKLLAGLFIVVAMIIIPAVVFFAYNGNLRILPPRDHVHLATFSSKIEFTARYWILGLVWLYISLHLVVWKRVTTRAANPLSGNEQYVSAYANIFTNSIEQFVMSVVGQITLITFLDSEKIISLIPVINVFYFIGRLFFWFGYPKKRSFGFTMTMAPISMAIIFSAYRFVTQWVDPSLILWRSL